MSWFPSDSSPRKFVIFTSGRSGSNLFLSVINQHPQVYCFSELYHPDRIWIGEDCDSKFLRIKGMFWIRNIFPRLFIHLVWYFFRERALVGFKYIWFHTGKIRDVVLLNPNVKKVLLTRRNVLRTEVSRQIADQTDKWISFEETTKCNRIRFNLDQFWKHYRRAVQQIDDLKRSLDEREQSYVELFYEDLVGPERERTLESFCDYLEIDPYEFKFSTVKIKRQNPFTLREILINYEEVQDALAGSELAWMLEEG